MRERIKDKDRLQHILDAIDVLQNGAQRHSLEQIEKDSILYFGFVKQVEIIGEAVYMLTKEFRESHPDIEWDAIEGMRHVLVHGYYEISPDKVWNVVEKDLPILRPKIQDLLGE